ncbi:competence protein ComK [Bacillus anthracis]|nr:competence protein ComK [Bacillus anthracis]
MMNHYFYNGRQVGAAITLAGAQGTIHAVNQAIQMQQQAYFAQMMQGQYMSYSQLSMPIAHYNVYPVSSFSILYGGTYFL